MITDNFLAEIGCGHYRVLRTIGDNQAIVQSRTTNRGESLAIRDGDDLTVRAVPTIVHRYAVRLTRRMSEIAKGTVCQKFGTIGYSKDDDTLIYLCQTVNPAPYAEHTPEPWTEEQIEATPGVVRAMKLETFRRDFP